MPRRCRTGRTRSTPGTQQDDAYDAPTRFLRVRATKQPFSPAEERRERVADYFGIVAVFEQDLLPEVPRQVDDRFQFRRQVVQPLGDDVDHFLAALQPAFDQPDSSGPG